MFSDLAFIQDLLHSRVFMLTTAMATVPLLAALMLAVITPLRRVFRRRQAKKQHGSEQANPAEALAEEIGMNPTAAAEASAEAPIAAPVNTPANAPAEASEADDEQLEEAPTEASEVQQVTADGDEEVPAHIQQILSSVFEDEATSARYEALLNGLDDITMADLSAQCQRVAGLLG